jgi:hypothetical protein
MKALFRFAAVVLGVIFFSAICASAGDLTIPNSFTADTPAVAAEVNANFTAVETAVDDNNTGISGNATDIATNATNISTNADDISANATDIATNATDIATNATNISTNADDISANAAAIGSLESLIVAYGKIASDATVLSGSNISSCIWNATNNRYHITISGESYLYSDYVTLITPVSNDYTFNTSSVGGDLLVYFYNSSGNPDQTIFSFLTLKP